MAPLKAFLQHPLTKGLALDDPQTTIVRRTIIQEKAFLRKIYSEWYANIASSLPTGDQPVLEIGSGAGFFSDIIPNLITSEVFPMPGVQQVVDATQLPFANGSLRAIVMTDVLHHIPDVAAFFREAQRVLQSGGRIVMVEPWKTKWSEFIYTKLHHEPFLPDASWDLPASGPLSGANGAIPWIVLVRDRERFTSDYPQLAVKSIVPTMPFAYLLSGGVGWRSILPGFLFQSCRAFERWLGEERLAMFAYIVIERQPE